MAATISCELTKEGDRNTQFFHAKAIWRARKNKIQKLEDTHATVHSGTKEMGAAATGYFENLFTATLYLIHPRLLTCFSL